MKPIFNLDITINEREDQTIAEMTIDGVIGEDLWSMEDDQNTKQKMREQLREVDSIEADRIIVNISSLGGDVDHGLAIHDLLAANAAPVETHVIGMTASAATIIAQAGDERFMSDNALYLVHRAWTLGMGNANDFEALADDLKKLDDRISNIYAKRSNRDQQEFMDLMNEANGDGIWISAEEAQGFGLIDEITEPMKAAAMPKGLIERLGLPKPPQAKNKGTLVKEYGMNTAGELSLTINGEIISSMAENFTKRMVKVGEDDGWNEYEFKEPEQEASASATSRERLKQQLETRKLKHKHYE